MSSESTTPEGARQSEGNEDDWHGVTDAKKRKQIQDKLAQRARRKRLREAKNKAISRQPGSTELAHNDYQCVLRTTPLGLVNSRPSLSYEVPYALTVFGALYINGQILGIATCSAVAGKSSPASPDVPVPLRPTPTQLLTVHFSGIDRFPFPRLRDNLITMSGIAIDDEQFTQDLFMMPSFTITPGAASWDPQAWKIEKPFAEKWGFLFFDQQSYSNIPPTTHPPVP